MKHADLHVSQVWCMHTFSLIGKVFFASCSAGTPPRRSPRVQAQTQKEPQCYTKRTARLMPWTAFDTTGVIGNVCRICKQSIE